MAQALELSTHSRIPVNFYKVAVPRCGNQRPDYRQDRLRLRLRRHPDQLHRHRQMCVPNFLASLSSEVTWRYVRLTRRRNERYQSRRLITRRTRSARLFDINLTGSFLAFQFCGRHMMKRQGVGSVSFISSIAGARVASPAAAAVRV